MRLLHKILGPSRNEIWKQFCVKIGAKHEVGGHWFSESIIRARHRNWTIVIDMHLLPGNRFPNVCTRVHGLYLSKDGFRFSLNRKDITNNFMKLLGASDLEVGPPQIDSIKPLFGIGGYIDMKHLESKYGDFDEEFVIKANDEAKVRLLFKDSRIREPILSQKSLSLEVSDVNHTGVHVSHDLCELSVYADGVVRDLAELERLYKIVVYTLDTLCYIGSADESSL